MSSIRKDYICTMVRGALKVVWGVPFQIKIWVIETRNDIVIGVTPKRNQKTVENEDYVKSILFWFDVDIILIVLPEVEINLFGKIIFWLQCKIVVTILSFSRSFMDIRTLYLVQCTLYNLQGT